MTEAGMLNLTIRDNLASPPRRIVRRPIFLSLCNVNLVDGLIWSQEAVGSNPTMETKFKDANSKSYRLEIER